VKFSDLNLRLKNASEGSKTVKSWRVVVRSESVQCLYFCDISDIDWASWMDGMNLDSILFPANTVLVACEREL